MQARHTRTFLANRRTAADDAPAGPDQLEMCYRHAAYVDKILKGAKPGDLPVGQPTKFEFLINLKTTKALGIDVPLHLQQIADEVIE
jgi:putative ABC transport system substrate-binding protein